MSDSLSAVTSARPRNRASLPGRAGRGWLTAAGWVAGGLALLAFFVRISLNFPLNSDEANNALQAWDMLHGNLLLHGWILGDVTFYTFELPVIALTEVFFGLSHLSSYVASSLVYLIVVALAVALAVRRSDGAARLARCGVAVAILAIPLAVPYGLWVELGPPDHMGTSAFILVSFLLIDRDRVPRYTAPLVGVILCAGQLSDVTVRYVAVPAIILVSLYHMAVERRIRTSDGAIALAAAVSVPAEIIVRAVLRHLGGYMMVEPDTGLAPPSKWGHNARLAWDVLRWLFGADTAPGTPLHGALTIAGLIALFIAAAGLVAVAVRWRTASRADQLLALAIVFMLGAYVFSNLPTPTNSHEIAVVLPAGAILAARLLVPARIKSRITAGAAVTVAAAAALVPLITASTFPVAAQRSNDLIAWLSAHHLKYGLAGYWSAGVTTENAGGKIQLFPFAIKAKKAETYDWETNTAWYDASKYDANFVAIEAKFAITKAQAERVFGKPASIAKVPGWTILVYDHNLLTKVKPAPHPRMD